MQADQIIDTQLPLQGARILLVEDEVIIAMDLSVNLEDAGATVTHARRQAIGLTLATEMEFDAAILDVNLGGGATCEPIAGALRARGVPFLLHTGDLQESGQLVERLNAPVAQKPVGSEKIIQLVAQLLG